MQTIHFIAGMPRSGSTLLCNVLAQNPRFLTTETSGIMDVLFGVRNQWDNLIEFRAHPHHEAKLRVLRAILSAFYMTDKPVIFDKCRGWLSLLEMAEVIIRTKAKVLVPIRDIRDVLASFEKLHRQTTRLGQSQLERENYFKFQTVQGRCEVWLRGEQAIGLAHNRIKDAIQRGYSDRLHFVRFEDLTARPGKTLGEIHEFLEEEPFDYNFEHVEQVTWEDDAAHGIKGLHDIRPKVEPVPSQWLQVLGPWAASLGYGF